MDFNEIYGSKVNNDDQAFELFKAECKKTDKWNKWFYSVNFDNKVETMFSERKMLDEDSDTMLGRIFEYCVANKFGLDFSNMESEASDFTDGYAYEVTSEYDNFSVRVAIDGGFHLVVMDAEGKQTVLHEFREEDILYFRIGGLLINTFNEKAKNVDFGNTKYVQEDLMDYALDRCEYTIKHGYPANAIFQHWADEGWIDHVPTKADYEGLAKD